MLCFYVPVKNNFNFKKEKPCRTNLQRLFSDSACFCFILPTDYGVSRGHCHPEKNASVTKSVAAEREPPS